MRTIVTTVIALLIAGTSMPVTMLAANVAAGTELCMAMAKSKKKKKKTKSKAKVEKGEASYYADKFEGRSTASGEPYKKSALTAAHRTLPFGTVVRVTNQNNGKSVDVRINDRGPFKKGRVIDLSGSAAKKIDMIKAGVVPVTVEVIKEP